MVSFAISKDHPGKKTAIQKPSSQDILALQTVPTFGSSLKPSEPELLLTYLLAPYMRIPPHGGSWDRGPLGPLNNTKRGAKRLKPTSRVFCWVL